MCETTLQPPSRDQGGSGLEAEFLRQRLYRGRGRMGSNPNTGFDLHSLLSSLSSVQFKIGYALGKSPHVLHPVSQKFPQRCLLVNNDRRTDQGPAMSCVDVHSESGGQRV